MVRVIALIDGALVALSDGRLSLEVIAAATEPVPQ
jgi:hypothetical protein